MTVLETIANLINQQDVENALNLILEHEEAYLGDAVYWNLRGSLCFLVQEYDAAVSCFQTALAIDPLNADVCYNCALAFEKMGNKSDAALYYGRTYRNTQDVALRAELSEMFKEDTPLFKIFEEATKGVVKHFIILSSCAWGSIYQRMHHIARSLKKLGHSVSYVTPVAEVNLEEPGVSSSDLTSASLQAMRIVEGVRIYTPMKARRLDGTVVDNYTHLVQSILDDSSESGRAVVVTYMPYQVHTVSALRGDFFHIYDCVDDHSDLEYAFWGSKNDVIWEQQLMDIADAITTTATALFLHRTVLEERQNVHLVRNGVNGADFTRVPMEVPEDLKCVPEPRIVYAGAIYDWFNKELFYDVVASNPDKSFVVIGFGNEEILDREADNLYLLGPKKHSDLRDYLSHCQVGIVPFRDNTDLIVNCDPIKLYEYIACGLPVVTTMMPEAAIDKIYTRLADTPDSFSDAIQLCLQERLDQEMIEQFVVGNSWNSKAATMSMIVDGRVGRADQMEQLDKLKRSLGMLLEEHDSPVVKVLHAVCFGLGDSQKFVDLAREAHESRSQKYVERLYLTALMTCGQNKEFVDIASKSVFIREELRLELLHCSQMNDPQRTQVVSHLCVWNVREAMRLLGASSDKDYYYLYATYIGHLLGGHVGLGEMRPIKSSLRNSPLFHHLENKARFLDLHCTVNGQ